MSGGRPEAPGDGRRGRRAMALAAGGLAAVLAAVWWLTRAPAAAEAPRTAESPSAAPARWPYAPIEMAAAGLPAPAPGDPLLDAIPSESLALGLEVNALVHSPLGRLTLECLDREVREALDGMARAGVDPRVDVDRVALAWDGDFDRALVVATGRLGRADLPALARALLWSAPRPRCRTEAMPPPSRTSSASSGATRSPWPCGGIGRWS